MNKEIKILLIEDNQEVRENTAEILELSNYKVLTADNGKTGVELALKELPDLIICDIMMPVLDGFGVLHLISKHKETADTPFIFLSAKSEKADFRKGMELGADDYLTKPFEEHDLLKAVDMRLKKSHLGKSEYGKDVKGLTDFLNTIKGVEGFQFAGQDYEHFVYKKKQLLYVEGNRPHNIFFLINGKVKTYKISEDGKEFITGMFGPGDFLGYTAILEESFYMDTAEIIEDSEIIYIPQKDFLQLINTNNQIAKQFIKLLTHDVLEKEEQLLMLAYNSLRKRVANGLLQVAEKYRDFENGKLKIDLSRENLAHIIGTATESLIRTLSEFKNEKLIDINDGRIIILEKDKLKKILF